MHRGVAGVARQGQVWALFVLFALVGRAECFAQAATPPPAASGQGVAVDPENARKAMEALNAALEAYKRKEYEVARRQFQQAAELDRRYEATCRSYLALILAVEGKPAEAATVLKEARAAGLEAGTADAVGSLLQAIESGKLPEGPYRTPDARAAATTRRGDGKPWWLSVTVAGDYVSGIALPNEADPTATPTEEEDGRFWTRVHGGYRFALTDHDRISLSYTFFQTVYGSVDDFNIQAHTPGAGYEHAFGDRLLAGVGYDYSTYLIGSELDLYNEQHHVYANGLLHQGGNFWLRGQYDFVDLEYDVNDDLDAQAHYGTLTQFLLLPDWDRYVFLTYTHGEYDADEDFQTFTSDGLAAGASYALSEKARLIGSLGMSWERYDGEDPIEAGETRDDGVFSASVRYERNLTDHVLLFVQYAFRSVDSNLARQEIESHTATMGVTFSW
ncbi:MAG: hypothetical protein HYZ53_16580 [Planctomycetes bacterium]|nr:hypothetical protein [Planctomycetota bacterium]